MGESSEFPKSYENQILKLTECLQKRIVSSSNDEFQLRESLNSVIREAIIISLIHHFEADFLWKVGKSASKS